MVNAITTDDLVMQGVRSSTSMILTLYRYISAHEDHSWQVFLSSHDQMYTNETNKTNICSEMCTIFGMEYLGNLTRLVGERFILSKDISSPLSLYYLTAIILVFKFLGIVKNMHIINNGGESLSIVSCLACYTCLSTLNDRVLSY